MARRKKHPISQIKSGRRSKAVAEAVKGFQLKENTLKNKYAPDLAKLGIKNESLFIRDLMAENLKRYAQPDVELANTVAQLETDIQLLENRQGELFKAGKDKEAKELDDKILKLYDIKYKFFNMIFKYNKPIRHEHVQIKDEDDIVFDVSKVNNEEDES